ncbi:hypothetical protein F511_24096 [Dorcoceras hygrometricum]|uniref:C-8 sterol isomerase n=1 Tax=Dorcoceras hygrometricum TaxID=472368 RepID=A0A2Z7A645_9LAMI|nr:hypothetical protein F511_24096 [Dorcoceras hygrometricum]
MVSRKSPKPLEETSKTMILTPNSSVKSSTTVNSNASEIRGSVYFPGCRKDANCNCEICIASFNATLDLMPQSKHRSSLTKFPSSRPIVSRSPVAFNPSSIDLSTPRPRAQIKKIVVSPPLNSTSRIDFQERVKKGKRELGCEHLVARCCLVLILFLSMDYGVSWMASGVLETRLSPDIVKNLGEKSWDFEEFNTRFLFLENELQGLVGKKVSSCSSNNSLWRISEDGLLLHSRCVLYESMSEEISIWGWPLQTAGLLSSQFSPQLFSIISGRVTQWSNGEAKYTIHDGNCSWVQEKWSASVVQFDPNTWVLEYKRSFILNNPTPLSALMEFLKLRMTREFEKMRQEFWVLLAFGNQNSYFSGRGIQTPT